MKTFFTSFHGWMLLVMVLALTQFAQAQNTIQVSSDITTNTTWTRNNVYILNGYRYVKDGATLSIEPGTVIRGDKASKGTLIIAKTGKIFANGTAAEPIVFTSNEPVGSRTYGDWGGLVILGNAVINVPAGTAQIEGGLLGPDAVYGGTNDDDSSGVLRYVRIEFPGIAYQPNSEINGLTMGGVGRKTVIENIQVSYSGDDAFEWFGGTVNGKYLITHRAWDDDFDTDFGFSGKIQFALSIRDAAIADQSQSNGFESDNDGTGTTNAPITSPLFSNVTIIGPKENGTPAALYRRAMHLRRNTRTSVYNSVFMGYPTGLHIDGSAAQGNATNDLMQLENVVLANMTSNFEQTSGANSWSGMDAYFNSASRGNQTYASTSSLGLAPGYNSLTNPALLPASGSILLSGASFSNTRLTDPFFMPVNHRGAFGTWNWAAGWSNFNPQMTTYGVPTFASGTIQVTADITSNTTWTKNNVYILNGYRYVKDGATLSIEPGTVIRGDKASKGTLIIAKTGKIFANGTAAEPIVFTSNEPVGSRTYGDWGGLVILGNAVINVPAGTAQIEGGLLGPDAVYGGTNDDDSSGVLRYVRIEFPGIAYQPNSEINGLTMGGVGRKTVIENIQVSYSGDDAFEWFGGTVNGKYLITHRAWDDDFDTDFGFSGKIQFALSIRDAAIADQSQSNGFESDNDGTGTTNAPITSPLFSNVTIIGPKENGTPAALYRRAMHLRRNTRTSVYNSVFMGYPTGLHIDGSAAQGNATNDLMQLENVVLANMTSNFEQTSGANSWSGMDAYFNSASRGNQTYASTSSLGLAPGYNSLTNPALLPASGSILLSGASFSNTRLTDPFFMPVNHRGAFGTWNWAAGWSNFNPNQSDYSITAEVAVASDITTNTTWTKDKVYILNGYRYVKDGATLTIEPGTVIRGDKASKGTLIIAKTGKINALGTECEPIVFTSNEPVGSRTYGDWGGLVILGNAVINVPAGIAQIEGGLLGPDAVYGGTNDDDSSGVLRYVRIEFPGIAYQPNSEINGLTMGGVGRKTVIENIQVSFSGDDAFEWFGGAVNGKYLITHRAWDDDFDTDFGFSGKIQFALSIRDAAIADQSQSNGFESDNDGTGTTNAPITSPLFSNVTIIGPKENGSPAALYRRAMHLRRNTRTSVYNSVFMGYPTGLHIDGSAAQGNATNDLMQLENVVLANMTSNFEQTSGANSWSGMDAYFNSASRGNQTYASTSSLGLAPGYNSLTNPALLPASGSILLSGASFSNTRLTDPFFMPVNHRGAFGTIDWSANWSNFDPQMTRYDLNAVAAIRHEPSGLSMDSTGVSSGVTQVRTNFNPGMGSDANFVRYRMGTGNWTIEPVTQLPMTLNLSAGMWEVQGGSRVMGAMYWTCSGFYRAAAVPVQRSVVFRVNMTNQTVGANGMYVAGNFQGWNATASPMTVDAGNPNIYQYTALVNANTTIEYKFVNSGVWESVPSNCAQNGNRFLTVVNDTVLPAFVYGSCGLTPPSVSRTVTFAVNMGGQNISANGVHVAGSFQGFNPGSTPMMASTTNPGVYTYTTQIPDGVTIEYKYINGNSFATVEQVPAACGVTDGFGGYNRFATINSDTTLPAYYFGTCSTVPPGAISGLVTYDNTASTIMTNTTVNLRSGSTVVATVNTGSTGTYTFPNVANGSYTLSFSTNKPWVGVNATDALRVAQFAAGQVTLAGIRFTAADVNNSNTVNNTDALQISQRTSQSRSSFTAGDWRFENPTITVNNNQVTQNIKALASGDANGSGNPSLSLREEFTSMEEFGVVRTSNGSFSFNLVSGVESRLGAATIVVRLPEGVSVRNVTSLVADDAVQFSQQGNDLYMSWFTLANCTVAPGTPLFRVDAQGEVEGALMVGSQTELADDWAEPLAQHGLRAPRFVKSSFDGVSVYPNPARDRAVVTSESLISRVDVLDVTGRVVLSTSVSSMSVSLDLGSVPAGSYLIRVTTETGVQTERIVRH